jgi:hypothetical protein
MGAEGSDEPVMRTANIPLETEASNDAVSSEGLGGVPLPDAPEVGWAASGPAPAPAGAALNNDGSTSSPTLAWMTAPPHAAPSSPRVHRKLEVGEPAPKYRSSWGGKSLRTRETHRGLSRMGSARHECGNEYGLRLNEHWGGYGGRQVGLRSGFTEPTHTDARTGTCTLMYTRARTCTHMCTHMHAHAHTHAHTPGYDDHALRAEQHGTKAPRDVSEHFDAPARE